jgi:two-component system, cell cycle response regulator
VAAEPLILVADDDDDLRLLVTLRLERVGYRVIAARDGREALALAEQHAPDLLLLDVSMPVMGGHDACRAICASQESPPPVIFLSAHAGPEDKVRGLDAGAVDYIAKPFNATELTARVAAALRTSTRMAALERDATIDHLTGVMNRAQLDRRLFEAVARTQRSGGELGCVIIDIDHFKTINDEFGHQTGDHVLRVIATRLSGTLRGGDLLFRYGGEEFFLLLEGTDPEGTITVATRSLKAIQSEPIMNIEVTASAGTASWRAPMTDSNELVQAADAALYEAKRGGRAHVRSADDPLPDSSEAAPR